MSGQASEQVNRLLNKGFTIKISEVVAGEFLGMVALPYKKLSDSLPSRLVELVKTKKGIIIYRLDKKQLGRLTDLVSYIKGKIKGAKDRGIDGTDVLILAYSIVDRECRGLVTFDEALINSKSLKDLVKDRVKDRKTYTITDRPP